MLGGSALHLQRVLFPPMFKQYRRHRNWTVFHLIWTTHAATPIAQILRA
jgi:hypothetical protein